MTGTLLPSGQVPVFNLLETDMTNQHTATAQAKLCLHAAETAQGSALNFQDQASLANKAFESYDFGEGVMVTDTGNWEYLDPGHERTLKVFVETDREDDGPAPRYVLNFTVRFNTNGSVAEAYALDQSGQPWGQMPAEKPQGNLLTGPVHESYIKAAADSSAELRKVDVLRVLEGVSKDNIDGVTRESLAAWIQSERPDLTQEVNEVMAELLPLVVAQERTVGGALHAQGNVMMREETSNSNAASFMSKDEVARLLGEQDEICNPDKVFYYDTLECLVEKVRSNRNWSQGEIFVFAGSKDRFVVMKQIAPDSCEMLTITNQGFMDVMTAYRFEQTELVTAMREHMQGTRSEMKVECNKDSSVDTLASLKHQRDLLAEVLGKCIIAGGIIRSDIDGLSGPQLIAFGEDLAEMLDSQRKKQSGDDSPSHGM